MRAGLARDPNRRGLPAAGACQDVPDWSRYWPYVAAARDGYQPASSFGHPQNALTASFQRFSRRLRGFGRLRAAAAGIVSVLVRAVGPCRPGRVASGGFGRLLCPSCVHRDPRVGRRPVALPPAARSDPGCRSSHAGPGLASGASAWDGPCPLRPREPPLRGDVTAAGDVGPRRARPSPPRRPFGQSVHRRGRAGAGSAGSGVTP